QHLNEAEKAQLGPRFFGNWQRLPIEARSSLTPPVAKVRLDGARLKVSWDWKSRNLDVPGIDFLAFQMIQNRGLQGVLRFANSAPGVTASDAVSFRSVLRQIGFGVVRRMESASSDQVGLISAYFDRGELCRACREVLSWPISKIHRCIELFTFRDARSEVWFQPLVELGENKLGFALHPLCHASAIRTAEWLIAQDSRKIGEKGRQFEDEVAASFKQAVSQNKIVKGSVRERLRTTNDIGDIDIL